MCALKLVELSQSSEADRLESFQRKFAAIIEGIADVADFLEKEGIIDFGELRW